MDSKNKIISNDTFIGMLLSILGIAIFSTVELNCKWLARTLAAAGETPIDGFTLCFQRFFWTGLILIALFYPAFRKKGRRLTKRDLGIFLLNGVICVTISISFYQFAVSIFTNASSAAVVFSSNALFTIFFARFINGEAWTFKKWLAVIIGIVGIACFVFEQGTPNASTLGAICLMFMSALTFACSVCITKKVVANYGPGLLMGFSALFGSILVLPLAVFFSKPGVFHSCLVGWLPLSILVIIGTALAYSLYYGSMKYISAYMASMTFLMKPVLACLLAICFAGEKMNTWTLAGTISIVLSLLVTNIPFGKRKA